ncbi:MAG: hypothetical protein WA609_13975 [Terriglobales bacterium]
MADGHDLNWQELCKAASETKSTEELLNIVRELNDLLEREERMHHGLAEAAGEDKSIWGAQC